MIGRLRRRANNPACGVTIDAGRLRRAKDCADVTTLASDVAMCTIEDKSCAEVVKRFLRICWSLQQQECEQYQ
jgi:hypothetical protein